MSRNDELQDELKAAKSVIESLLLAMVGIAASLDHVKIVPRARFAQLLRIAANDKDHPVARAKLTDLANLIEDEKRFRETYTLRRLH